MSPAMSSASGLPRNTEEVLRLAAQTFFDTFAATAMGAMLVDREHRIVWISEGYKRFLPALGHAEDDFVGRHVEDVVPNTLMAHVIDTGQPILVDLLTNRAGTSLVSRLPLRDAQGQVIGAVGFVLMDHPETTMQPLLDKFTRPQAELDAVHQQLVAQRRPRYTDSQLRWRKPSGDGGQAAGAARGQHPGAVPARRAFRPAAAAGG